MTVCKCTVKMITNIYVKIVNIYCSIFGENTSKWDEASKE